MLIAMKMSAHLMEIRSMCGPNRAKDRVVPVFNFPGSLYEDSSPDRVCLADYSIQALTLVVLCAKPMHMNKQTNRQKSELLQSSPLIIIDQTGWWKSTRP